MKKLGCGIFFVMLFVGITLFYFFLNETKLIRKTEPIVQANITQVKEALVEPNKSEKKAELESMFQGDGLHQLIGTTVNEVLTLFGDPSRIDLSAYDYEWWIYPYNQSYLQIGIENNIVVTVYYIGDETITAPFLIGQTYEELNQKFLFQQQVSFNIQGNSYQFNLTSEEIETRPLIQIDQIFIQLYFDTITKKLSGIRYLDGVTLVKQRPYSVVYRGRLIEPKPLTREHWNEIEKGLSLQILDITNQMRKRHNLNNLEWDEETSTVAFKHSKDMENNDFFSHTSPTNGELQDRLKQQDVLYQLAGENIAAKYVDAIAVVEGWLNSEGHRINLLHDEFTHLGVGVYERYYTQNFITPW